MKISSHTFHIVEQRGPACWIYFNRPNIKNALDLETMREFLNILKVAVRSPKTKVIVLSGKGGTFSSGGNIKKMKTTQNPKKFFLEISRLMNESILAIQNAPQPVIAAVSGFTGGIAFGLVQACDLIIASRQASFAAATIRLGLVANGGATYFLPKRVGWARAREILLLGDVLEADQALDIGMINRVVNSKKLASETQSLAEKLAARPLQALARLKHVLNAAPRSSLEDQLERERQAIAWSATTDDFQEGVRAFLKKRKPSFQK